MSEDKPVVYLAGPIQHVEDGGHTWRDGIEETYGDRFEFRNPLDKYDANATDVEIVSSWDALPDDVISASPESPLWTGVGQVHVDGTTYVTVESLVESDKAMIEESDAVLARWDVVPSAGTPMEIFLSWTEQKPVAVWYDVDVTEAPPVSPWIEYHADTVSDCPDTALHQLSNILDGSGWYDGEAEDDRDDLFEVTDPETGERLFHYEWNGWLWCEREQEAFDWETGNVECPHCGDSFEVPEADNGTNGGEKYTIKLTEGEVSRVLLALTVYANQNDEPTDGTTRQLGQMIAQSVATDIEQEDDDV